jgi:hypothetical protein
MQTRTVTTVLEAPKDEVFSYLSKIENLPKWATEFARELKYEGGQAKVVNGLGEFYFTIDADPVTVTRVVELAGGASAYCFTMFQPLEMPDELFESQYSSLLKEFDNISREFS